MTRHPCVRGRGINHLVPGRVEEPGNRLELLAQRRATARPRPERLRRDRPRMALADAEIAHQLRDHGVVVGTAHDQTAGLEKRSLSLRHPCPPPTWRMN